MRHEANLGVRCRCGNRHVVDAQRFARYCHLRRWNDQLEALVTRLACARCGGRPADLRATPDLPTPADPFPRDEPGWKRLQRRLRD